MPPKLGSISATASMKASGPRVELDVDRIDVGEALEQHRLAFHHRLGRQRAEVPRPRMAVPLEMTATRIALGGIIVGGGGIFGDGRDRTATPGE
jgi:hypothetical protein